MTEVEPVAMMTFLAPRVWGSAADPLASFSAMVMVLRSLKEATPANCFTPLAVSSCLMPPEAGQRPCSCADHDGIIHRRALDGDAERLGVLDPGERIGGGDERLGGDATPVQAGAAELFLFHDRDRGAQLGGANRGGITARAGANDYDIKRFHS